MTQKTASTLYSQEGPKVRWDDVDYTAKMELKSEIERTVHKEVQEDVIDWRMNRAMAYERARAKGKNLYIRFPFLPFGGGGFFFWRPLSLL